MTTWCLLQAACLVIGVLAWYGPQQVTAASRIYARNSYAAHDSSRLGKLLVLAARLESYQHHGVQKRFMGFGGDKTMEAMYHSYSSFRGKLTAFLDELVDKLTPDAPTKLKYLTLIPNILRLDDSDFALNNKDGVTRKVTLVMKLTKLVLATVGGYLDDDDQDWLQGKRDELTLYMAIVGMSFTGLEVGDDEGVDGLISGVGGINVGDPTSTQDLDDLKAAIGILQKHIKQDAS